MLANAAAIEAVSLAQAAALVQDGNVIAYPTEAVFGLGCDPANESAVARVLELKGRPADKGLILLARHVDDVKGWVAWDDVLVSRVAPTWPGPVTWILPATPQTPPWLQRNSQVALRVTAHRDARRLIRACGCALISTSANPAGLPPARTRRTLARYFGGVIALAPGQPGKLARPTKICDARTGKVLRDA